MAIVLVFISAFIHAGWNLVSKRRHPSASFFLVACVSGALTLSPFLWIYRGFVVRGVPPLVWIYLVATGFFLAVYYVCLAGAYRAGDMSLAYPLARSSPVIVVTIVTLLLGRGDRVTTQCVIGILLVVGGCFLIPMRHFRDFRLSNYWNRTCGLALLAAIATAGYSIIDDESLRLIRNVSHTPGLGVMGKTLLYAGMEFLSVSLWMVFFVLTQRKERAPLRKVLLVEKRFAVLAGVSIVSCYALVLVSLAFVQNVSYVVGFRQLSIPLGTVFAILILGEPAHRPKLAGVAVMFVGLMLIATG